MICLLVHQDVSKKKSGHTRTLFSSITGFFVRLCYILTFKPCSLLACASYYRNTLSPVLSNTYYLISSWVALLSAVVKSSSFLASMDWTDLSLDKRITVSAYGGTDILYYMVKAYSLQNGWVYFFVNFTSHTSFEQK